MGKVKPVPLSKLFLGVIVQEESIELSRRVLEEFGKVEIESNVIPFDMTDYYEEEMGSNLLRYWVGFSGLEPQDCLIHYKKKAQLIEAIHMKNGRRIFNLDPGILTESRVVLATTKDYTHRIYIGEGFYAEVTLIYRKGKGYEPLPWTYPDYKLDTAREFFLKLREKLREDIKCSGISRI